MKSQELTLKKLHKCLLMIICELDRICEKHGIPYFLMNGSLLGAVRHGGFIPWDDDMDAGIMRSDYNRLIRALETELDRRFFLSSYETERGYGFPYLKLRLNGTHFHERVPPPAVHDGIFVDIIPIDKIPVGRAAQLVHKTMIMFYMYAIMYKCGYRIRKLAYPYMPVSLILSRSSMSGLTTGLRKWQTMYNSSPGAVYANVCKEYYGHDIYPEGCLEKGTQRVGFEDIRLQIPMHPELPLTALYGDFMTPPPVRQQTAGHSGGNIDFGIYDDIGV